MKKQVLWFAVLAMVFAASLGAQGGDPNYKPKRINKMIELLEAGQPVYDISVSGAGYEEGKKLAQAHYDLIQYQMEHGPFNPALLREFMQGLVDGGPTKSGHRTPTVIVDLPVLGLDELTVRANHWVIEQVLSAGVHGLMLCHARTPEAVKAFISAARYPFEREGLADDMIPEGLRGSGSQGFAAGIWGISGTEYMERADPWPMNPNGEFILSLKLEDKYSLANVEQIAVIPGIAWAEWGPGDQAMSLKGLEYLKGGGSAEAHGQGNGAPATNVLGLPSLPDAELEAARTRIFSALKANNIFILHSSSRDNLEQLIRAGIMVTHAGGSPELSNMGRAHTKRQMPY
jgi:4-hydroxy-2-oxoheptanedioate aldolase